MDHPSTEISKRPWEAKAGDVLLRNPEHPDQHVEWTVTGRPGNDGWFTVLTYSMPEGGEGVAVCQPGQYVTIRGDHTYVVKALYTQQERDDALAAMSCHDRAYVAGFVREYYGEIFDHALQRLIAYGDATKAATTEVRPA
jgi:hypothetical protein